MTRCEFCDQPLNDSQPWKRGLVGTGAHSRCIMRYVLYDKPHDPRDDNEPYDFRR